MSHTVDADADPVGPLANLVRLVDADPVRLVDADPVGPLADPVADLVAHRDGSVALSTGTVLGKEKREGSPLREFWLRSGI